MKLNKVSVAWYMSIKSPIELLIDDKVNILIGANDHGKTNLLQAILKINEKTAVTEEEKNWDSSEDAKSRIEWQFNLNPKDIERLKEMAKSTSEPEEASNSG